MNGAEFFFDILTSAGVDTVFGLPGSTEAALLEALRARQVPRYVLGLHEGAVVSMADGYARVTGRPGVVGLHTTVGTLNGASQIFNAYRDYSPVVVTAGHKDRTVLSENGFCAHPHLPDAVRPFTKWAHQTLSAGELGRDLWRALHVAMTPPAGPAYLAIPEEFLREAVPPGAPAAPVTNTALWAAASAVPDERVCTAAAQALAASRWPVIVVGGQARDCTPELRAVVDQLAAPLLGADLTDLTELPFPSADHRFLGLYGENEDILADCDLILAVGTRLFYPFSAARHPRLPHGARVIHVHPDPAQIGALVPTQIGLAAAPAAVLRAVSKQLERTLNPASAAARAERLAALRADREASRRREREAPAAERMSAAEVAAALSRVLPADAVVIDEGVRSSGSILRHLEIGDRQRLLRSSGGALGWGVPAAIGASLGQPGRPVVALVGDGSYQFSVQAVWTAVQQGARLVVVVLDNGGYLAVKRAIEGYLAVAHDERDHPGTRLPAIDHAGIARGYGADATVVERPGELAPALAEALAADGMHVLAVPIAEARP